MGVDTTGILGGSFRDYSTSADRYMPAWAERHTMRSISTMAILLAFLFALGVGAVSAGWQVTYCAYHIVYVSAQDADLADPGDQPGWLEVDEKLIEGVDPGDYPESAGTLPQFDESVYPFGTKFIPEDSSRHIKAWHDMEINICHPGRDIEASAAWNYANMTAAAPMQGDAAAPAPATAGDSAMAGMAICTTHEDGAWIRSMPGISAPKLGSLERGDRITNLVHGFVNADSMQRWQWAQFMYQGSPAYIAKTSWTGYC